MGVTSDEGRGAAALSRMTRLGIGAGVVTLAGIVAWLVVWLVLLQRSDLAGSTSTRSEELAWLDEAEVVADEFLLGVVDPDELPEWERIERPDIRASYVVECNRTESVKLLPGQEATVRVAVEQEATDRGFAVVHDSSVEIVIPDGSSWSGQVPEFVWVEIPGDEGSERVVRLYLSSSESGARLEVGLLTDCYQYSEDGTLPDS
jgi:hypothetical protein